MAPQKWKVERAPGLAPGKSGVATRGAKRHSTIVAERTLRSRRSGNPPPRLLQHRAPWWLDVIDVG
jgi:hypothetical protein